MLGFPQELAFILEMQSPIMTRQMEKNMDNEMETVIIEWFTKQVPNSHILPQNLYHNDYYPNPKPKYWVLGPLGNDSEKPLG